MTLKLYFDFLSQPSRGLYMFLKLNKIPFEPCQVALRKGEHLSEEFKETLSRFQKVPFIHDGDFKLNESIAIIRYLTKKHGIDSKWYPNDLEKRARVDEYLEWQHNNTRLFCALYFQLKWLLPILGSEPNPELMKYAEANMEKACDILEDVFLKNSNFLTGNKISIADVFAACELEQPRVAGYDPSQNRPVLKAWWDRVKQETQPIYDEAHQIVNKLAKKAAKL